MNETENRPAPPRLPGVIDTLGAGFRLVNRHLYLLLLPVALDVFYWLGPRLSVRPLAQRLADAIARLAASPALVPGSQSAEQLEMVRTTLTNIGDGFNLYTLLSGVLSIPTLQASQDVPPPAWMGQGITQTVSTVGQFVPVFAVLFVLGVALGALYLGLAAQVVRDGTLQPARLAARLHLYGLRYLGLLAVLAIMAVLVGLPASLVIGIVTLISPLVGSLLLLAAWGLILWFYFNVFFVLDALFISDVGPLRALINSVTVVRLSTSTALGLVLAVFIITWGMSYVWEMFGASALATLMGIIGNAYIGTGLTLGSMVYYRDRMAVVSGTAAQT